jgi:hypothetical protein
LLKYTFQNTHTYTHAHAYNTNTIVEDIYGA